MASFLRLLRICLILSTTSFFNWPSAVHCLDLKSCNQPLGMESGKIPDENLHASTSYVANVGPGKGRLNQNLGGGAWCPHGLIEMGVRQFLEVDLGENHVITAIGTQGRHDKGRGVEYVEEYVVEYWRPILGVWRNYSRWDNKEVFKANQDVTTVAMVNLSPPIHAQKIRIYPYSLYSRIVCMRMELYGCIDNSGVVSYTLTKPSKGLGDHTDRKYDGYIDRKGRLTRGLGCLTDGQVGGDFYNLDIGFFTGTGWVAWHNSSTGYFELTFEFATVRNFSKMDVFTNNYFTRNVQLFRVAEVYFSIGGKFFNGDPVILKQRPDLKSEKARNITIMFEGDRLAKFIKIRFYFATDWVMISEVFFESQPSFTNSYVAFETVQRTFKDLLISELEYDDDDDDDDGGPNTSIEITLGVLLILVVILMVIFIITLVIKRRRSREQPPREPELDRNVRMQMNMQNFNFMSFFKSSNNRDQPSPEPPIPLEFGPRSQIRQPDIVDHHTVEADVITHLPPMIHHLPRTPMRTSARQTYVTTNDFNNRPVVALNPADRFYTNIPPKRVSSHDDIALADLEDFSVYPEVGCQRDLPRPHRATLTAKKNRGYDLRYEQPIEVTSCMNSVEITRMRARSGVRRNTMSNFSKLKQDLTFGLIDLSKFYKKLAFKDKLKGNNSNSIWNIAPCTTLTFPDIKAPAASIPDYSLQLLTKVGYCTFGELRLYETSNIKSSIPSNPKVVMVKMTYMSETVNANNFMKEMRFLTSIKHPAIWNIYGIVKHEVPPLTVFEYSTYGDLYQLVRSGEKSGDPLPFSTMIFMIIQMCSALKYMESRNIIHKDLGTRNCMVFAGRRIKLCDVAGCMPMYKHHYDTLTNGKVLPVRWLAWENVILDRYTCSSTVWSFAVTIWEILTCAKYFPYPNIPSSELVNQYELCFYGRELREILPIPNNCPQHLYTMMTECWQRDDTKRPTFENMHQFLVSEYEELVPKDYDYSELI